MAATNKLLYHATCVTISNGLLDIIFQKSSIYFEFKSYTRDNHTYYTNIEIKDSITGKTIFNISDDPKSEYFSNRYDSLGNDITAIKTDIQTNFYAS